VLIVVDEAQNLGADALEEIRLLTNLGQGDDQPVQLVLVGQPELETIVDRPELAQLRQRIRVHYRLASLSKSEIEGYVRNRMSVAGSDRDVFTRKALSKIFEYSGGVPRLVNTFANEGLLSAFVAGRNEVRAEDIEAPRTAVTPDEAETIVETVLAPGPIEEPRAVAPAFEPPAPAPAPTPAATYARPRRRHRTLVWASIVIASVVLVFVAGREYLPSILASVRGHNDAEAVGVLRPQNPADVVGENSAPEDEAATATDVNEPLADVPHMGEQSADGEQAEEQQLDRPDVATEDPQPEVAPEELSDSGSPAPVVTGNGWCAHINSFRAEDRAVSYARDLRNQAGGAFYRFDTVRGVGWYRVFVGPYGDRPTALAEAHRLQREYGIRYYKIVRLDVAGES